MVAADSGAGTVGDLPGCPTEEPRETMPSPTNDHTHADHPVMTPPPGPGRLGGAAAGLAAAAVGLAAAEALTLVSDRFRSPVLDVGDRVVDLVPPFVKDLAIAWFGTNDKVALLVGIGATLAVAAALAGVAVVHARRRIGHVVPIAFGVLGAVSVWTARVDRPAWAVLPAVLGALVAGGGLVFARRRADDLVDPERRVERERRATLSASAIGGRRAFIGLSAAMAGGAAVVGVGARRVADSNAPAADLGELGLPAADAPLAPLRAGTSLDIDGITSLVTPNDDFYRIDTALTVPRIDPETWTLRIHGMVDDEIVLDLDDLRGREIVEADITMTCVSNLVGGGLVGHARWLGVRLDDLLAEAGIDASADQIVGRSVDGYTCGFPTSTLDGRDALIAIGMNGEPLPPAHGFPARLVVPGLYGYVSATKWLTEIELTRFDAFDHYWVPRGYAVEAPIKTQTRIDLPATLADVPAGPTTVAGVAWAQTRGIEAVEVRVDDGPWRAATLADAINADSWRQWAIEVDLLEGRHTLEARSIDGTGAVQTDERVDPLPDGATGRHKTVVFVGG